MSPRPSQQLCLQLYLESYSYVISSTSYDTGKCCSGYGCYWVSQVCFAHISLTVRRNSRVHRTSSHPLLALLIWPFHGPNLLPCSVPGLLRWCKLRTFFTGCKKTNANQFPLSSMDILCFHHVGHRYLFRSSCWRITLFFK